MIGQVQTVCKGHDHAHCVILSADGKLFHAPMKKLHGGAHVVEIGAEATLETQDLGGITTVVSWWTPIPDYIDKS